MSKESYIGMRKSARRLDDPGGYRLNDGEMNSVIFDEMLDLMKRNGVTKRVWEPFAGPGSKRFWVRCVMSGFEMESYGLVKGGCKVLTDSTESVPEGKYGGVIMHPPYYGSDPQSDSEQDLSRMLDWKVYSEALEKVFGVAVDSLDEGGFIVAVGRDYRALSSRVRLDLVYVWIMESMGMELIDVWISEPDVAIVARKI